MEYQGLKLFGTENHDNEPVVYKLSDMGFDRHDTGEFMSFIECPTCGRNDNLSRIVCQFCGQRFKEVQNNA